MSLTQIIDATASAVAADEKNASVVFRAAGSSPDGVASTIRARQHVLTVDEPPTLGGADTAANPVEYALAALVSCQVVAYRFWAAKLGIALNGITVEAEGDLDVRGFFGLADDVRPGFSAVRVAATLTGPESAERYEELQAATDAHCPVFDLFGNPTPVTTELKVTTRA
ncbi:OsmC family protein [Streptomyces specialis]|uniref:OsmC family protein n=1 Tax=Streptomyces specialis TaxID=498367 RepID=UPI00073FA499|nr:OsmC family protein [Streptomyces specialis]